MGCKFWLFQKNPCNVSFAPNLIIIKRKNKRAVSEVVATLLMVTITVIGAVMLSVYFQNSGFVGIGNSFNPTYLESQTPPSLKITGYDTRDNSALFGISNLDNKNSGSIICTKSCNVTPNATPAQSGTEFIVLKVKNDGTNSYVVRDILINDVDHLWDGTNTGTLLNPSSNYPNAGNFRIIDSKTDLNFRSNEIKSGQEKLLIIKLSQNVMINNNDISYNMPLKVVFTGSIKAPTFVVYSGDIL